MLDRISIDPNIRFGKPVVEGTRISVQDVLELINEGLSFEAIRADYYPDLSTEDLDAVLSIFAKD